MSTSRKRIYHSTIHLALTARDAALLSRLASEKNTSQGQTLRNALALLAGQQPTAVTAAQTIDAAMERIANRLQVALAGALTAHAEAQRTVAQADLQAAINTLLRNLLPGAEIVAAASTTTPSPTSAPALPERSNPRSLLAEFAQRQVGA